MGYGRRRCRRRTINIDGAYIDRALEGADRVEGEDADGGGADYVRKGDSTETIARVVGVRDAAHVAAVVTDDENFTVWYDGVDRVGDKSAVEVELVELVRVKGGAGVAWVGPDSNMAVFDDDAFAGEADDALDDELVSVASGEAGVAKDDDLAAAGDVVLA